MILKPFWKTKSDQLFKTCIYVQFLHKIVSPTCSGENTSIGIVELYIDVWGELAMAIKDLQPTIPSSQGWASSVHFNHGFVVISDIGLTDDIALCHTNCPATTDSNGNTNSGGDWLHQMRQELLLLMFQEVEFP